MIYLLITLFVRCINVFTAGSTPTRNRFIDLSLEGRDLAANVLVKYMIINLDVVFWIVLNQVEGILLQG